jgi:KDO2-lipid IV(A) lauroyltransferase
MKGRLFIPQELKGLIEYSQCPIPGQGKVVVGVHLSNFDFALHTLVRYGARALTVTVPSLGGGYQAQFKLRVKSGLEIMPASIHSFRLGIERLKAGGLVLTGIDRPIQDPKHCPVFFGYPAPLPVHHVYMALKADAPILLMSVIMDSVGIYRIVVSEPIYMKPNPDRNQELVQNAEAVLSIAEQFIKQAPEQWAMYFPVWPGLSETVP